MTTTTRMLVATLAFSLGSTTIAAAATTDTPAVARYTAAVRAINPHLPPATAERYAASVLADAVRMRIDPRFLMAIVTVESHWQANATSRVGARGLGQLMPATARTLRVNAWDPTENLRGTSRYLRALLDRFNGAENKNALAIAAYNAGPHAVQRYNGVPPFAETQRYVVKVMQVWNKLIAHVAPPAAGVAHVATAATPEEKTWMPAALAPEAESAAPVTVPVETAPSAATAAGAAAATPATETAPAP